MRQKLEIGDKDTIVPRFVNYKQIQSPNTFQYMDSFEKLETQNTSKIL
jgi:hypothetical protein